MNKLGFAIEIASAGLNTPLVCNEASWSRGVVDVREYLKLFDGLYGTDNIVTFFSFDEGGCLLTQLKSISGRPGDFMSGWIYIPNTIDATGEDVMNAYNYVRNKLSLTILTPEIKAEINDFFAKEYPTKQYTAAYTPSLGERYGVRYIGMYTMKEILDSNRFQSYYNGHKAIFILEKNDEVVISNEAASKFDDFTNKDIAKMTYLMPPSQVELQMMGRGVKIYIGDDKEFTSPVTVGQHSTVKLLLRKPGFEQITLTYTITQSQEQVKLDGIKEQIIWKKRISKSMFDVFCPGIGNEANIEIRVNGIEVSYNDLLLDESACRNATVEVSAYGYDTFEHTCDLTKVTDKTPIQIHPQKTEKQFEGAIELANGCEARIVLKSKDLPDADKSLLKTYYKKGNKLYHDTGYDWKQRGIGFAAAIAIVLVVILGIALGSWAGLFSSKETDYKSDAKEQNDGSIENTGSSASSETSTMLETDSIDREQAIKYLDNSKVWIQDSMEKYPCLQGLFDAMNNYDFDKVKNISEKLNKSKKLEAIKSAIETCKQNQGTPEKGGKDGKHVNTYNKPGDKYINVNGYDNYVRNCKKIDAEPDSNTNNAPYPTPRPKPSNVQSQL